MLQTTALKEVLSDGGCFKGWKLEASLNSGHPRVLDEHEDGKPEMASPGSLDWNRIEEWLRNVQSMNPNV